jgi:prepilin-type N-terminal cleavage/methylation domain-containing protein
LRRGRAGFTLIEMAMVIAIIGLLAAGITALLSTFLKSARSRVAGDNSAVVQQSLQRFIERYGRLPCPAVPTKAPGATGYGVEDAATTQCAATAVGATGIARGVVPWVTLGLPVDQVEDGYTHMFSYNVTIAATQTTTANASAMKGTMTVHSGTPAVMGLSRVGNQINSCWTAAAPPATENSCNMDAVVVLVSHGENGFGAYTSQGGQLDAPTSAGELENVDANVAFVKGDPNSTGYDDLVFAWSPDDLMEPLARQGTIKSATAVTNDSLRNSAVAISNFMVNNTTAPNTYTIPAASPVAAGNDAWGAALVYASPNAGASLCSLAAGQIVFTLTSVGIDGVAGLNANTNRNDDITISVTVDPLRAQINNRSGYSC